MINLPVGNDSTAFVLPKRNRRPHVTDDLSNDADHTLPYPAKIAKIEDVVKLCWRRQHFDLRKKDTSLLTSPNKLKQVTSLLKSELKC